MPQNKHELFGCLKLLYSCFSFSFEKNICIKISYDYKQFMYLHLITFNINVIHTFNNLLCTDYKLIITYFSSDKTTEIKHLFFKKFKRSSGIKVLY